MSNDRDNRAAARDRLRNLELPNPLGRAERLRSRTPSPVNPGVFFPQGAPLQPSAQLDINQFENAPADSLPSLSVNMATPEQLTSLREELRAELRRELRAETAAAAAATPDAIRRKPEIPAFDKSHIEIWIRRMEHSYTRAGITSTADKFAWLETKFPVGTDPRVDEYLYGDATPANWDAFLAYLRKEYGPTTQQKASIFIDGFKRDGRRPSQFAAALDEKTKNVSIDDIKKEMLLREIPTNVRRMLQERIEGLNFKEAADIADHYFDSDGRPKHSSQTSSINEVTESFGNLSVPGLITTDDEATDMNAVNSRPKRFTKRRSGPPSRNTGQSRPPASSGNNNQPQNPHDGPKNSFHGQKRDNKGPSSTKPHLCKYHQLYGDEARTCQQGCTKFPKVPSNDKAGRQA